MPVRDDAGEFAAKLRQLKDSTDLSYGALARELDMNVSTLHRYCAGEGVPQDFSPVERLATFCGATPQERLELHRLWLSAVAARQRVRTADSPEAAIPAPAPHMDAGAGAGAGGGSHREGVGDVGGNSDRDGDRDGDGDGDVDGTGPAKRRRRTPASTVAACVCALLVITVASLSALSDDRSAEADPSRSASPRTTAAGAPGGSVAPSATQPSETTPADSPLTWTVDSLAWDKGCDHDYVIDKPPAEVPPPPFEQDAEVWVAAQSAVHGRHTKVRISVQGRSSTAVVLDALHVRVVSRGTPGGGGTAYAMGQGCGSELTPRRFAVNLDADRPVARPQDGEDAADGGRVIPAVRFPYRVSAEDPEVLEVDATTQIHDARWYLELDWSSQGRTGTIRVDDHGSPFRTTGIKGMPHYWYGTDDAGRRAWVPLDSY
ncbi:MULTISPECIES: helix-turn-helix domain-containing protein [unclassified Streptomyces]|uniref:helix-turn-helix domain-containing protein n=1 Tax=unclassified Streptomyces TaxID=2593676 RepID=UPI002E7A06D7|nr:MULTISPECIES: helix-turn-helix transcriptional regulator [unclassified Streptomyces]MEE1758048.1 helix-turn-helix transcriptional regulator [Streptomyces sp. SP18BB07]MEE1832176.1 helix-turn-helix transcriptional regulator [Streptomyces sp. SP17KL33]